MKKFLLLLLYILLFATCKKSETNPVIATIEVTISSQVWMIKNLDVTTYRNGDPIARISNDSAWYHLTTGAYCYYNNDSTTYAAMYGKLYNWYAVTDVRGLAPPGWHVPSDSEWTSLSTCLGGDLVAGGKLKETGTAHWSSPNYGATNNSEFTALPGGFRYNVGLFLNVGLDGRWWSSTEGGNYVGPAGAWYRGLAWGGELFVSDYRIKQDGYSVRCVRD